ncbi:hypothetical protein ACLKA7_013979 [Drosophila subpalustris]
MEINYTFLTQIASSSVGKVHINEAGYEEVSNLEEVHSHHRGVAGDGVRGDVAEDSGAAVAMAMVRGKVAYSREGHSWEVHDEGVHGGVAHGVEVHCDTVDCGDDVALLFLDCFTPIRE